MVDYDSTLVNKPWYNHWLIQPWLTVVPFLNHGTVDQAWFDHGYLDHGLP